VKDRLLARLTAWCVSADPAVLDEIREPPDLLQALYSRKPTLPTLSISASNMPSTNDLEAARANVFEKVKIDILTETQELDNEKQLQTVARSFICAPTMLILLRTYLLTH
jgi:hypothetical protein